MNDAFVTLNERNASFIASPSEHDIDGVIAQAGVPQQERERRSGPSGGAYRLVQPRLADRAEKQPSPAVPRRTPA